MCYDRYSERYSSAERERWWGARQKEEAPKEETTTAKPEKVEAEAEFVMEEFEPSAR